METRDTASLFWGILFVAWLIAMVATMGALFIGEIMGQTPCILCWYQRIFMFPLAIILGIAVYRFDFGVSRYALPLSIGGLGIAVFHSLLYFKLIPEDIKPCEASGPSCSSMDMTILGGLPIPLLSVISFLFITLLLITLWRKRIP